MARVQPKAVIGIGSVVQLKSGGPKLTIVGVDTFKATLTVIWASANDNIGKAEIPAAAVNILKS